MTSQALICSAHALGGYMNRRGLDLTTRCVAAAEAGFGNIGLSLEDYERERSCGRSDDEIRTVLRDHAVAVPEVEYVRIGGALEDGSNVPSTDDVLHLADVVGARHIVCVAGARAGARDADDLAGPYQALCEAAAAIGVMPLIEPMPWSRLSTLAEAAAIVTLAGHPAGGIVLDTWHFHRVDGTAADIPKIPADLLKLIQISDAGPPEGDPFEDTVRRRRFPGDGGFALVELLREARRHGVRAPVSVEVIGEDADRLTPLAMARRSIASATAVLEAAGYEPSF